MRGRPLGSRDFTAEQFRVQLEAAHKALGQRHRGWHSEEDIAAQIGISRGTLRAYRHAYGFPRERTGELFAHSLPTSGRAR